MVPFATLNSMEGVCEMRLHDLVTHPSHYLSVAQLCEYWALSRNEIYKQIEAGTLPVVRLGPRLYRVRKEEAIRFEQRAGLSRKQTKAAP